MAHMLPVEVPWGQPTDIFGCNQHPDTCVWTGWGGYKWYKQQSYLQVVAISGALLEAWDFVSSAESTISYYSSIQLLIHWFKKEKYIYILTSCSHHHKCGLVPCQSLIFCPLLGSPTVDVRQLRQGGPELLRKFFSLKQRQPYFFWWLIMVNNNQLSWLIMIINNGL